MCNQRLFRQYLEVPLSQRMGVSYDKSDDGHFERLVPKVAFAIRNAEKLCQRDQRAPCEANPSTTVHRLVDFLNQIQEPAV